MNPHLQQILHDITVRITKLEEAQQQRTWVGLTDEDQFNLVHAMNENDWDAVQMMDAIEAKLKEKNT